MKERKRRWEVEVEEVEEDDDGDFVGGEKRLFFSCFVLFFCATPLSASSHLFSFLFFCFVSSLFSLSLRVKCFRKKMMQKMKKKNRGAVLFFFFCRGRDTSDVNDFFFTFSFSCV